MKIDLQNAYDFHQFVDVENGTVDRAIFADQAIYDLEMERIFARAWNFMCHESQIPKAGDFFLSFIGEESVIATRDKKGELQVLLNSCRHRGNAVCRAEAGNARSFLCTYHGWTYGLDGSLIGVPGYKDFYHEQLDKSQWGLVKAGKVASYKGFVFATMDPEAVDLDEYLGEVGRMGLDLMAARGELIAFEGVQKNIIGCNWKLAVDNLFDWYHVDISHASAMMGMMREPPTPGPDDPPLLSPDNQRRHRVILGPYGHAIGGPRMSDEDWENVKTHWAKMPNVASYEHRGWRGKPEAREVLGDLGGVTVGHPNIFPNLWVASGGTQLSLRLPKGPGQCEIWWFTLREKDLPEPIANIRAKYAISIFGPGGLLEQDDGENWDQSTRATRGVIAQRYPLNYQMDLNLADVRPTPGGEGAIADRTISERAQLWTLNGWADFMSAESWAALKADKTPVPTVKG